MGDTWTKLLIPLIPVVVGAGIGFLPTLMLEKFRASAALRTRWDITLHTACAKFAACTRRIVDISEEAAPDLDADQRRTLQQELDREHRTLQELMAEVRLLGNRATQEAARAVVRDAWALRTEALTGADPRKEEFGDFTPRSRTLDGLLAFYAAARRQLQVPEAADLIPLNLPLPKAAES
ncbi:hypothetical protein V6U81_02185 [Micromonospora sp. CPCC 205711]|uniref:hypothetical protein n=1 Tax=Micromonospora sp. CPCC 205547 TaxID=3122400 RepID=UPI002FF304AE